ncbi:hypothetical protein GH714_011431 [Hevea brasiliensis]|uniref:C2H2-type domain-containing protein n=1 Tax=Hevea brasiliensis TaxID=3981 RepID=A0A6A6MY61_HEVBR|nr:hypothetical protein GH714_011431 [Hevea brasiliensis]
MEKAQCLMWMKRRQFLNSNFEVWKNLISYSWEEKAFAEDAPRTLGGCMWPPRSYSCSFCKREFRSAQALGGHMNVHRRDRARLKQSLIPQKDVLHHQYQNHTQILLNHLIHVTHPRNPPTGCYGDISCKRPKTNAFSMIKPRSSDRHTHQPEVIEPQSSSMEDIDLELRLGRPPKVK